MRVIDRCLRALCALLVTCVGFAGCGGSDGSTSEIREAEAETAVAMRAAKRAEAETAKLKQRRDLLEPQSVDPPAGTKEIDGPSAASGASGTIFSGADRRSFQKLASRLPGREGVAVSALRLGGAKVQRLGALHGGVAWSTAKVPVAMAAVAAGVAREGDLRQAITASNNAAAERLWSALGVPRQAASAATAQLVAAGDQRTQIQSERLRSGYTAFGQTSWALTDQVRFTAGMACVPSGRRVIRLMSQVIGAQRWGLGLTGGKAQFKGGWGPGITPGSGGGWLDRQMGIVTINGRPLAVTLATDAGPHESATPRLTTLAKWVASHASARRLPTRQQC